MKMEKEEKKAVYEVAMQKARELIGKSESEIFLRMRENVPVRFVKRGEGMFEHVWA